MGRSKKYKTETDRQEAKRNSRRKYKKKNKDKYKKYKYFIGELKFTTKQGCMQYVRNKINSLGCCEIDKTHNDYEFFSNLIDKHPERDEKIGLGIDKFIIERNKLNTNSFSIYIKQINGFKIVFSWVTSAVGNKPNNLLSALRCAIVSQILNFRNNNKHKCVYCGSKNNINVDHKNPSFKVLSTNFINQHNNLPTKFDSDIVTNQPIFSNNDIALKLEWFNYHKKNATYQILCRTCNIKKGSK